ncbi:tripartite-type tricarboxylate transporter receptor subunit TctC [Bradyrhizobium diazoefficiens]
MSRYGLRTAVFAAIHIAVGALLATAAGAQDYPSKPVTLIVPWPAGGSTDISMRAIADSASKVLGQPIVIDNKAGGGGTVGPATMAAAAKPDGYTISQIPITVFRLTLDAGRVMGPGEGLYLYHSPHRLHVRRDHQR